MNLQLVLDARLYRAAGIGTFLKNILSFLSTTPSLSLTLLHKPEDRESLLVYNARLIPLFSPVYTLSEQRELQQKIPPCALFWSPHFNVPLLPIQAKKRLTTIHDVYHLAFFSSLTVAKKCYAKIMYQAAFSLSDCITTPSEFSKQEILKWATWRPKQIVTIPNACTWEVCTHPQKENFFLCVGTLKPHKNFCRVVEAYALLKPKEPLIIVGKKEGLREVDQALFQRIERDLFLQRSVRFMGYISDEALKELYKKAKLFIFPSYYEGFGYPPLEAMASSCPVVAANAASIPEVCQDAVEYIDPFSLSSLVEGIQKVAGNQKREEELIHKGHLLVKHYTLEKMRESFLEVIENLV